MEKYGITPNNNVIRLGRTLQTNNSTISNYYLYSISEQKFLTVYGLSEEPISKFNIICETEYRLYNQDNQKYLAQTKISTNEVTTTNKSSVGVIYYPSIVNEELTGDCGQYSRFRVNWTNSQSNTYTLTNTITCREKTPTLDITMGKDATATAHFNCFYMGNGSDENVWISTGLLSGYNVHSSNFVNSRFSYYLYLIILD